MMTTNTEIKTAIIGALKTFQGFGGFIASSRSFSASEESARDIDAIDTQLSVIYDNYDEEYHILTQYFCYNVPIGGSDCFLIIRAKKEYTPFPERNRFYDRREYYYYPLSSKINCIDFFASLPEMRQFNQSQISSLNDFSVSEHKYKIDSQLSDIIVYFLINDRVLNARIFDADNAQDIQNRILGALSTFPHTYRKYLAFAFNVKPDSYIAANNITIYTTLDENGLEIDKISIPAMSGAWKDFKTALFANEITYPDDELKLKNPLPGKNDKRGNLTRLLHFHWLHFCIDKTMSGNANYSDEGLFETSQKYVEEFLSYYGLSNAHVITRIKEIFRYWKRTGKLNSDLLLWFLQKAKQNTEVLRVVWDDIEKQLTDLIAGITSFSSLESEYRMLAEVYASKDKQYSLLNTLQLAYLKNKETYSADEKPLVRLFVNDNTWIPSGDRKPILEKLNRIVLTRDTKDEEIIQILSAPEMLSRNAVKEIIEKRGFSKFYSCLKDVKNDIGFNDEVNSELKEIIKNSIVVNYTEIKDKIDFAKKYHYGTDYVRHLIAAIIEEIITEWEGLSDAQYGELLNIVSNNRGSLLQNERNTLKNGLEIVVAKLLAKTGVNGRIQSICEHLPDLSVQLSGDAIARLDGNHEARLRDIIEQYPACFVPLSAPVTGKPQTGKKVKKKQEKTAPAEKGQEQPEDQGVINWNEHRERVRTLEPKQFLDYMERTLAGYINHEKFWEEFFSAEDNEKEVIARYKSFANVDEHMKFIREYVQNKPLIKRSYVHPNLKDFLWDIFHTLKNKKKTKRIWIISLSLLAAALVASGIFLGSKYVKLSGDNNKLINDNKGLTDSIKQMSQTIDTLKTGNARITWPGGDTVFVQTDTGKAMFIHYVAPKKKKKK